MALTETKLSNNIIHNYYIDLFRFILMTWIVLFHYTVQYNALLPDKTFYFPVTFENGGTIGVSLFFIVSGFFMTRALMISEYGLRGYGKYVIRRYLRLWVPYAFACVIIYTWLTILPVEGRTVDYKTLMANVCCIIHSGFDRVDNAHWFLADLLVVQLLLGLIIFVHNEKYRRIIVYFLFAIVMMAQVIPPPMLTGFSKELFEVLLGVLFCMVAKNKESIPIGLSVIGSGVLFYLSLELFVFALVFLALAYLGEKYPPHYQQKSFNSLCSLQHQLVSTGTWYIKTLVTR